MALRNSRADSLQKASPSVSVDTVSPGEEDTVFDAKEIQVQEGVAD